MFRKKINAVADASSGLFRLAVELGVEKRFSPRVSYPPTVGAGLPKFNFGTHTLRVHDISTGGCSLFDPQEIFGAQIGLDYKLTLDWGDVAETVNARLVGRVDVRRNFQFLDLPRPRVERIRSLIAPGVRGTSLHLVHDHAGPGPGPRLAAIEVWTSSGGDSVTLETDATRLATIYLTGKTLVVPRAGQPHDDDGRPATAPDLDAAIMFLANAPQRSLALDQLLNTLEARRTGRG